MNLADTILAVSSPAGPGQRAILRLSGPDAVAIADRAFAASDHSSISAWPTFAARPGRLEPPGTLLSAPAVAYLMRGPKSYTREDVVEFHVGAWPALEGLMVEGLLRAGARAAGPGEFTCRALLAGRLDLAQAEAVMAVVGASSEASLRAAGDLLSGHLSREIEGLVDRIRDALVRIEVDLDFSDQDIETAPAGEVARRLGLLREALADLGRRSRGLETFAGEVRLVIAGRPNVGKSSLFNRLLLEDRAIVAPQAGTTRDELRAALHLEGVTVVLSDTAGLDPGAPGRDELAGKARAKALEALERADLVLLALDATSPDYERTRDLVALLAAPMVVAVTKCDLESPARALAWLESRGLGAETIATSAVTGEGLGALRAALVRAVEGGAVDREASGPVVTARHRSAMEEAAGALGRAERVAREGGEGELVALELREALAALGGILGREADAGVLERIFARFCIGK
ncbi:MAG: tRNA modification GTPase [Planctomycetota bacterium]|nr:tRNA modification GTPase [Planctomycetota bacterium]